MKKFQITTTTLLIVFLISSINTITAQDGRLIRQKSFKADKELINELEGESPGSNYSDTFALAEMSEITYESDGLKVKGFIIRPVKPGKYPCVIYNRDGHENTLALNEISVARDLHKIARWGYVVIASQYRGAGGGEGRDELGGKDINDVLNLIPLLGNIPEADTTRIGMYGINRGGMMTYLALKETNRIDAAIVAPAIANLFLYAAENVEYYNVISDLVPDYPEKRVTPMKERSMLYWAEELCKSTPILLLQGSSDTQVHPTHSLTSYEKLFAVNQPTRLLIFEGGDNSLSAHQDEVDENLREWFDKYVRDLQDFPYLVPKKR